MTSLISTGGVGVVIAVGIKVIPVHTAPAQQYCTVEPLRRAANRLAWAHVRDTGVVQACLSPVVGHGVKRVLAATAPAGRVGRAPDVTSLL